MGGRKENRSAEELRKLLFSEVKVNAGIKRGGGKERKQKERNSSSPPSSTWVKVPKKHL